MVEAGRFVAVVLGELLLALLHHLDQPFVASDQVSVTASMVVVYDTSYTRPDIAVLERHVIIRSPAEDGTRRVLELIGLLNGGFLTRITDDSTRPVWQSAIPSEALQFEVGQSDVSPHTIFRMGDSVAVVAPLSPGSKQILITYLLPKSLDALTIPVDQPVRDMNIMLEDASATIGEGLFKLTGVEELERVSLFRYNAVEVEPGTQITVQFAGGGPLDGVHRNEQLPEHWRLLRVEQRNAETLHVYSGSVPQQAAEVTLHYVGAEPIEGEAS